MTNTTEGGKLYRGLVDYVLNASSTTRHYVRVIEGASLAGLPSIVAVCGRTITSAHVVRSDKLDPAGPVDRLTTCRNCGRKAVIAHMVTRERAAELDAAATAEAPAGVEAALERLDAAHRDAVETLAEVEPVLAELEAETVDLPEVEQPAPAAVGDAITIENIPGVWIVTHTPDSLAEHVHGIARTDTPVTRVMSAFGYWRARPIYVGGIELMPIVFAGDTIRSAASAADSAQVGQLGVWFTAGNGPVIVPIAEEWFLDAPRYADRMRTWQQDTGREADAMVVVRVGKGWVDGRGRTVAAAPAPVEAIPSPVDAPPAPALPQVDDAPPLARRDLVTYNGNRYVIIRSDSLAERDRSEGQVELYPGDVLPDHIPYGERGHWVEASACSRRLVLEWGTRHPEGGRMVFVDHPGRAYAECVVESIARWGDGSARLVVRVRGGEWQLAPMRTEAEREAGAAAFLASLD